MSQRYAKLYAKAGENPDIGELLEDDPLAVSLFFLAIARADVYGILPADPRRFRARVAPAAALSSATVAQSLHNLESHGLVRRYTASDGTELLHIVHYSDYQDVRWANRIGPPEYELPPWWEPPEAFLAYLESLDLSRVRGEDKRKKWVVLRERYCSATVALRENNPTQNTEHRTQNTEDVNVNVNTNGNDLLSESADDALPDAAIDAPPADPPATKPKRKQRKAMTDDEAESMIALARADLPPGCLDLVETLMDLVAAQNKTGRMALSREATLTTDLADKCKRDGIGTDALRHGLTAAISKGAGNINYVIKAANGYDPARASPGQPSRNGKLFITLSDGTRCYEDSPNWSYGMEIGIGEARAEGIWNQRTGCTTVPSRGFCCDDGWFYDSRDDGSMYQARRWNQ